MNKHKKIFIFLPDGVGVRNFALTNFKNIGESMGCDVSFWNNTIFPIEKETGCKEIKLTNTTLHPMTTVYTRARKRMELNVFDKKFKDTVYNSYNFPQSYKGVKKLIKSVIVDFLVLKGSNDKGIESIRQKIKKLERSTSKYEECKKQLEQHRPDFIFCTNQRTTQAIAPLLAAQDLEIPTATFIFSWDNLPKATTLVEVDYYFVWSEHMKKEALTYLPYVKAEQIIVSGTPQFESHFEIDQLQSREEFFSNNNLDIDKRYICFSGDDITTSPLDQYYLEDMAKSVRELNTQGYNLGVIYRKCPVDFTDRYDEVLKKYSDVLVSIAPLWRPIGESWDTIMPSKEDFYLLANICQHTEFVGNIGSSMVFDFVAHGKSCLYFNYEQPQLNETISNVAHLYDYVHFRSMPNKNAVLWVEDKKELTSIIKAIIDGEVSSTEEGGKWFKIIAGDSPTKSSELIWQGIDQLIKH